MDFEPIYSLEATYNDFLDICREIVDITTRKLYPQTVRDLTTKEQQELVDRVNQQVDFEFNRKPELHGLPLVVNGDGLMYLADGCDILGAEHITEGEVITGYLDTACVLPIPTYECVLLGDNSA